MSGQQGMALPATWQETAGGWFGVVMLMLAAVYCMPHN